MSQIACMSQIADLNPIEMLCSKISQLKVSRMVNFLSSDVRHCQMASRSASAFQTFRNQELNI